MVLGAQNLAFLAFPGLPSGQVSLINYVHAMSRIDDSPFIRSAFSPANLSAPMLASIEKGRRSPVDRIFLASAALVAGTLKQTETLKAALGEEWRSQTEFVPAVERELTTLDAIVGRARSEATAWRKALRGYNFEGMTLQESFDVSQEESFASILKSLQIAFLTRISNARTAVEEYGPRSFLSVEVYFGVMPSRKSGPLPRISPADLAALAVHAKAQAT